MSASGRPVGSEALLDRIAEHRKSREIGKHAAAYWTAHRWGADDQASLTANTVQLVHERYREAEGLIHHPDGRRWL